MTVTLDHLFALLRQNDPQAYHSSGWIHRKRWVFSSDTAREIAQACGHLLPLGPITEQMVFMGIPVRIDDSAEGIGFELDEPDTSPVES